MGFRLFVSHSTPEADLPRLTALVAAIEAAAGDTKLDVIYTSMSSTTRSNRAPGDDWRQRIAFMLHACHAAIVILDENARNSDWVLTEAIFLSLRNQVDPDFQFIPVNFLPPDDGTADALDARAARAAERAKFGEGTWRVVDLSRIQQARGATEQQVADLVVERADQQGNADPVPVAGRSARPATGEQLRRGRRWPAGCGDRHVRTAIAAICRAIARRGRRWRSPGTSGREGQAHGDPRRPGPARSCRLRRRAVRDPRWRWRRCGSTRCGRSC